MQPLPFIRVTVGTCLKFLSIGALVCALVFYVHFQARNLLQGPVITLDLTDTTSAVVQHTRVITLTGTTRNIVKVTLNGREIYTNEQGAFSEELILEQGYTKAQFVAHDRFGHKTTLTKEYVYVPTETAGAV